MRARVLALVATLLLAGLAGCGAFGGQSQETLTPAPVPTPPPTPEDPRMGVAPGVDASGITDLEYLVRNHVRAAMNTSYVWREQDVANRQYRSISTNSSEGEVVIYENATHYRRMVPVLQTRDDGGRLLFLSNYSVYGNGEYEYARWYSFDDPNGTYHRSPDPDAAREYASLPTGQMRRFLQLENETVHRVVIDGQPHYVVVGTRESLPAYGPVEDYRARAVIRPDGFIRHLNVTFTATQNGQPTRVHYVSNYSQVGTATVEPPSWFDEARERFAD